MAGYTRAQWVKAFLQAIGNGNPSAATINWVINWTAQEDNSVVQGKNNLLNTTLPMPGSRGGGTQGNIQYYSSFAQGVQANALTLKNGLYPELLRDLQTNNIQALCTGSAQLQKDMKTWGTGWNAWYCNAPATSILQQVYNGTATTGVTVSRAGTVNNFPAGQCTHYADERYHELTGIYVPFPGNANEWATNAPAYGWKVSSQPVVPSIICLQAGVQLASATYGHVGVVEGISKGKVTTTDLNWGPNPTQVVNVTFSAPAPGVSFIYAVDSSGNPIASTSSSSSSSSPVSGLFANVSAAASHLSIAPNASVTQLLVTIDEFGAIKNPFDTSANNVPQDTVLGATFDDPVQWLAAVGGNTFDDTKAIGFRLVLFIIGAVLFYKVLAQFVDTSKLVEVGKNVATFAGGV